jgi:hypothetical protein
MLMRLILKIEQISSTPKMVGVPQPTAAQSAGPPAAPQAPPQQAQQAPPAQVPQASLAPAAPSRAPSPAPIAVAEKKSAQPSATVPASITPPEAFVPAFANASAAAKANVAPSPKQPEVRRAEPVRPEDLAKATGSENSTEATGPNRVAIKPLKKTYIKVVVDNESKQPAFERWISPSDGTVEFRGQKISVRVLDRDAIRITKNGKPVSDEDDDVSVE